MSSALPELVAGRYRLVSPLGQGGMGRVWKARDEVLHRDVAIKELVPPPGLSPDERRAMRERSLREARAIARLNHINVVRVFDVLRTDADPWIVMEYVPSRSLQHVITTDGPVPPARAAEIGLGVLGALQAAHKAGVMHRDVKPGNVLLGDDGRVVLTDFGLATVPGDPNVTRTGLVLGSPAYIAPERARDGTAGPEADLWSLGATLYAAVEGHAPFARPSAIETLAALATEPLPPPKNAGPLKAVLNGLLRKDPAERISAEVAERLLRRIAGRRTRGAITLFDGVRRAGPRAARPVVPVPRPAPPTAEPAPAPMPAEPGTEPPTAKVEGAPAEPEAATEQVDAASPAEAVTAPVARDDEPRSPGPAAAKPARTATMPAQREPTPAQGRSAVVAPAAEPRRKGRRGWLIGGAVVLVLLALAVAVPLLSRDTGDGGPRTGASAGPSGAQPTSPAAAPPPTTAAPSATASATASPSATGGEAPPVPGGWKTYEDPTGFSLPVPAGWSVKREHFSPYGPEDWRVRFTDGKGHLLLIDQTTSPKDDAVADWKQQEAARRDRYSNYELVTIRRVDYWDEAADWEWTMTESGRKVHVRNRGFVTAPDKGYAIRWDTPAETWTEDLALFDYIAENFRPVRQ